MDSRALQYPRSPWEGLRQSTFSPLWEQSYEPLLLAPCPDLVRPRCPPPGAARPSGISADAKASGLRGGREEAESPPGGGGEGEGQGAVTSAYGQEFRRRSYSAASASEPATPRRRRDSYVPHGGDGGGGSPDWPTTTATADTSPEAAFGSRSRSIILRKSKRRPDPPQRSVSLRRDAGAAQNRGSKTQSLYLPGDAPLDPTRPSHPRSFLPDLVLISKPRAEEEEEEGEEPGRSPASPAQAQADLSVIGGNPGRRCGEVTDPYCTALPLAPGHNNPAPSCRPESGRPPPPPRGRLPQTPPSPTAGSPPPTPTAVITGPSPLGCRMRPRPSPDPSRGRSSRLRLSLELPTPSSCSAIAPPTHAPTPDPVPDPAPDLRPKAVRRHSDSSAFCHPRSRRLSVGVAVMPVVTQEELSSVRLRPLLGSSDANPSHEPPGDVAAATAGEGPEREACPRPPPPPQGPKARPPPVAAKPPVPRWLPGHTAETETPPAPQNPPTEQSEKQGLGRGQGEVTYMKVQRPKPKRSHHHAATRDDITQQRPDWPLGHAIDTSATSPYGQSETRGGVGNCPVRVPECVLTELQRKSRVIPPPVARKPDIILRPSTNNHLTNTGLCLEERGGEGSCASQMTRLRLGEQDLSPPRTEDLFTIIHRSKKKLLSGRECVDIAGSRQTSGSPTRGGCDPHAQGQGQGVGGERSSSKTDSFMAFLQRRRSQKPNARERVSAAELLKTSKHLTNHSTEQAQP